MLEGSLGWSTHPLPFGMGDRHSQRATQQLQLPFPSPSLTESGWHRWGLSPQPDQPLRCLPGAQDGLGAAVLLHAAARADFYPIISLKPPTARTLSREQTGLSREDAPWHTWLSATLGCKPGTS